MRPLPRYPALCNIRCGRWLLTSAPEDDVLAKTADRRVIDDSGVTAAGSGISFVQKGTSGKHKLTKMIAFFRKEGSTCDPVKRTGFAVLSQAQSSEIPVRNKINVCPDYSGV